MCIVEDKEDSSVWHVVKKEENEMVADQLADPRGAVCQR